MKRIGFVVVTLLLQLAVGEDFFWLRNSNWDESSNWRLGRVPCGGEVATLANVSINTPHQLHQVRACCSLKAAPTPTQPKCISLSLPPSKTPANSLIYLKSNVTVRRIVLPTNGKIVLKPSITIRFSEQSASCKGVCASLGTGPFTRRARKGTHI